jgi:hypothetical protein
MQEQGSGWVALMLTVNSVIRRFLLHKRQAACEDKADFFIPERCIDGSTAAFGTAG